MSALSHCLVSVYALCLAPAPKEPMPDPLARGYLGIVVASGTMTIDQVEPNTPAARAGLRAGDTLFRVGTLQPEVFEQVVSKICSYRPGTLLELEVRRGTERIVVSVRLAARPEKLGLPAGTLPPFTPDE